MTLQEAKRILDNWKEIRKNQQFEEGIELYQKAKKYFEQEQNWREAIEASCRLGFCLMYVKANRQVEARAVLEEADEMASKISLKEEDRDILLMVYRSMREFYKKNSEPQLAYEYLHKALELSEQLYGKESLDWADTAASLLIWNLENNQLGKALERGMESRAVYKKLLGENHQKTARIHNIMGIVHKRTKNLDEANKYFQKALDIYLNVFGDKHLNIARVYNNLGTICSLKGDYGKASQYLQKSLSIDLLVVGKENIHTAMTYMNLGVMFKRIKDSAQAKIYLQKVINFQESDKSYGLITKGYVSLGQLYHDEGNLEAAEAHFREAIARQQKDKTEDIQTTVVAYLGLADTERFRGNMELSEKYTFQALEISAKIQPIYHPHNFFSFFNLGQQFREKGMFDKGLHYYQETFKTLSPTFQPIDEYDSPALFESYHLGYVAEIQTAKSIIFWQRYLQIGNEKDLVAAFETLQNVVKHVDIIRLGYDSDDSKLTFLKEDFIPSAYEGLIESSMEFYRKHPTKEDFLESAFKATEKSKANILLGRLKNVTAKTLTGIPNEMLQKEKQLKMELTQLKNKIEELKGEATQDEFLISQLQGQSFDLEQEYQTLIRQFEKDYPQYYQLKHQVETVTIETLQQKLPSNTALVEYFIGDKQLYIFVITSNDAQIVEMAKPDDFEEVIEAFKTSIDEIDKSEYCELAFELYQLLIAPIEEYRISNIEYPISNLKIIPAGILSTIPFEALLTEEVTTNMKYADLPYLLLQYDINYHYSATLWSQSVERFSVRSEKNEQSKSSFIGFAPVYKSEQKQELEKTITRGIYNEETTRSIRIGEETFSELIYSEEEVNTIQSYFNAKNIPTQTFLHADANTSNFLQNVGKHKYVLISAHGFYNEKQPDLTGIILSPNAAENSPTPERFGDVWSGQMSPNRKGVSESSLNDESSFIFYLSDAYNLELNADLVVLSCCETGVGKLAKGEGVMALNRGFFYAGAKNVIYTLFKVYDQASCQLTKHLFQYILESLPRSLGEKNYSSALKEAKRKLILEGKAPIHWAGYLLIGE